MAGVRGTRRRHSAELKTRVLDACNEPGASVARIAMEHGLNANLVHRWRRLAGPGQRAVKDIDPINEFIALPVLPPTGSMPAGDIRISIRRGGTTLDIRWPVAGAGICAQWLSELLQ